MPTPNTSDTPRTDIYILNPPPSCGVVSAEFARELERENNRLKIELERIRKEASEKRQVFTAETAGKLIALKQIEKERDQLKAEVEKLEKIITEKDEIYLDHIRQISQWQQLAERLAIYTCCYVFNHDAPRGIHEAKEALAEFEKLREGK